MEIADACFPLRDTALGALHRPSGDAVERLYAWRSALSRTFVDLRPEALDPSRFRGRLRTRTVAGLKISDIRASAQTVRRSAAEIDRSPAEAIYFVHQLSGDGCIEHGGGRLDLRVGDSVLFQPNRPYLLGFKRSFRQLCVQVPEWWLRERAGDALDAALGRRLAASRGVSQVLGAAALALLIDEGAALERSASELFLDVLTSSSRLLAQGDQPASLPMQRNGDRLRGFIAVGFRDERLSPAHAAAALGCSLRTVHKTAAASGTSFNRLLMEARLSAAAQALVGGEAKAGRISDVAYACGFSDQSHFSRSFKQRFGMSPRDYRARWS